MSLATLTDIQTAVNDYLGRSDLTDSQFNNTVALFEAYVNRTLRVRQMETSTNLTTSSGAATLPTDYLAFRSVTYNGSDTDELAYVTPTELRARFPNTDQGTPVVFTIEDTTFTARPVDDTTTITLRYFKTVPALSDSNTSNWLLAAYPDAYLFGCLTEANAFFQNVDGTALWKLRRDEVISEITELDTATKGGGNVRPIGWIV